MTTPALDARTVRPSPIAGTWYPAAPRQLADTVDALLAQAGRVETQDALVGLIAPHAGYPYSGQTAACAYRQLAPGQFDTVVLLGPSHRENFGAVAATSKNFYWTPLGNVALDQALLETLTQKIRVERVAQDREHSLEIQLPFLQRTLGAFTLVPLMLAFPFYLTGASAWELCAQLAAALADLARNKRVLLVASSDLSHLENYTAVQQFDARTEELLAGFDIAGLAEYMARAGECRACGDAAIITLLLAAHQLGANRARVFQRTNSGDVTGERDRADYVVGYLAAGVYRTEQPA